MPLINHAGKTGIYLALFALYFFSFPNEIIKEPLFFQGFFPFVYYYILFRNLEKIRKLPFFILHTALNFCLLSWLVHTIHQFGEMSMFLSLGGVFLISLYLSVYPLLFLDAAQRIKRYPFLFPVIFTVLELIRGSLFTGFAFNTLGYSLYKLRLLILPARFYTVYGVGFFVVLCAALLSIRSRKSLIALLFMAAVYFIPLLKPVPVKPPGIRIALLQTSFEPEDKRKDLYGVFYDYHLIPTMNFLDGGHAPDLIVWSETAMPDVFSVMSSQTQLLASMCRRFDTSLISGCSLIRDGKAYNAAFMMETGGEIEDFYAKMHLVPFGEFFPFKELPFFKNIYGHFLDFERGKDLQLFEADGVRVFTPICYEIAFGSIVRKAVRAGAEIIVNISNDGWYGYSSGPVAEIPFCIFRAIESGKWVMRAINRGWGLVVAPDGRIICKNKPTGWGFILVNEAGQADFYRSREK